MPIAGFSHATRPGRSIRHATVTKMQHNHAVRAGGRFAATLGIHLMKQLFQRAALLALALCAPFAVQAQ
ncbi:MAG TPA: hypothetical protein PLJ91_10990, partial [Thermomonas sp.]|nr:hypothetical protein [Thermomonas sp.]